MRRSALSGARGASRLTLTAATAKTYDGMPAAYLTGTAANACSNISTSHSSMLEIFSV